MRRLLGAVVLLAAWTGIASAAAPVHGVAIYGEPKYGPNFEHFDYVNPQARKGGTLRLANVAASTFNSLNQFILKGSAAAGLGYLYDTLMEQSLDEPFAVYGRLAQSMEIADDRSHVRFRLREGARFHDGHPVTAEDVVFTFETLREDGHPFYRSYYADVGRVEKTGPREVTFFFRTTENRELPLILGQIPILPAHYWEGRDFTNTTLEPPLGSGPYRLASVDPGKRLVYERVEDYWGRDLPVNRGRYNVDRITYDYYRDGTVALQALKAGEYDLRQENVSKNWATAYDIPAVRNGLLRQVEIPHSLPAGMQGFFYNTRRAPFDDPRVREALAYAFDFQWTNQQLFYGAYSRTDSYFENSFLEATGMPSEAELALLEPHREQLPERVFTEDYSPPTTAGEGNSLRGNLRTALGLLREAGWVVRDGQLVNESSGRPFRFEILLVSPSFERVVLPFAQNLRRLGIEAEVRTVDPTQYQNRIEQFDFDMTVSVIGQSLSPGNEQREFWTCEAAAIEGSRNIAGVCNPAIDALVDALISAPSREQVKASAHALDRALLWNFYAIPNWFSDRFRLAYWDKFGRPESNPPYGLAIDSWWVDPERAARLADRFEN